MVVFYSLRVQKVKVQSLPVAVSALSIQEIGSMYGRSLSLWVLSMQQMGHVCGHSLSLMIS